MRRRKKAAGKENNERWLITYSDLITLLLIFFVIMYAMSKVDVAKFLTLSESLNSALDPSNQIPLNGLGVTALLASQNPSQGNQQGHANVKSTLNAQSELKNILKEEQVFSNLYQRLQTYVHDKRLSGYISLANQERGIQITLKDVVLFDTGQDTLRPQALHILAGIVPFLQGVSNAISVEGYTDNVPIDTPQFPSNWELSTGRAVNVVKYLTATGIVPSRLSAVGYGQYHPVVPNTSDANRQMNRRVNIVILRNWVTSLEASDAESMGTQQASSTGIQQAPSTGTPSNGTSLANLKQPIGLNVTDTWAKGMNQNASAQVHVPNLPSNIFNLGPVATKSGQ